MERDAFREHWRDRHGPLIRSLPDFRRHVLRYEQNPRLDEDYARDTADAPGFDGVTVQWFDSRRDFYAFATEPSYRETIFVDEERFIDRSSLAFLLCEEPTSIIGRGDDRARAGAKLIAMLQRRDDLDREAFREHWSTTHAALFRDTPELARHIVAYDQQRRLDGDYDRDAGGGFDGVTEQWYTSYDTFLRLVAEPALKSSVLPDERKFLRPERTQWLVTRAPDVIIDASSA
jgi:uncharacterized protein (TIGR02118 family)